MLETAPECSLGQMTDLELGQLAASTLVARLGDGDAWKGSDGNNEYAVWRAGAGAVGNA